MPGARGKNQKLYAKPSTSTSTGASRSPRKRNAPVAIDEPRPKKLYFVQKALPMPDRPAGEKCTERQVRARNACKDLKELRAMVMVMLSWGLEGRTFIPSGRDVAGRPIRTKTKTFILKDVALVNGPPFFDEESGEPYWLYTSNPKDGTEEIRRGQGGGRVAEIYQDVHSVLFWLFRKLEAMNDPRENPWTTVEEVQIILDWFSAADRANSQHGDVDLIRQHRARRAALMNK